MLASLLLSAAILGQCAGGSCSPGYSGYGSWSYAVPAQSYYPSAPVTTYAYATPVYYVDPTPGYVSTGPPRGWLSLQFDLPTYRQRRSR